MKKEKKTMMKKLLSLVLLSLLSFSIVAGGIAVSTKSMYTASQAPLQATKVLIEPQNGTATVGALYTITVKVVDVTNLYGFGIQIRWGTAVLKYISHLPMAGEVGGVLNQPIFTIKDTVDETASLEGSAAGTTYWYACLSFGGAAPFSGNGTLFTMTFQVLRDGECDIYFTGVDLSDNSSPAKPISYLTEDAYFYRSGLNDVPVADFTLSPDPAVANKTTTFDASSSYDPDAGGDISLFIWNFRDGTIENTTSPTINHTFTTIPYAGYYSVELTVLDDQGEGSQSKPKHAQVYVVHPRPVAQFTIWPEDHIAVVDRVVTFNASESYDPDPGGSIVEYRWNFGDSNLTNTPNPIITHRFHAPNSGGYSVELTVLDDSDGFESDTLAQLVIVVQRRDIEVASVTASPDEVRQGEDTAIDVTIANKGEAQETFNITAYYNTTMTNWIKVDETSVSSFQEQYVPQLEFMYGTSLNSTVYHTLKNLVSGGSTPRDNTKVRVGTDVGYWTMNPGLLNTASSSPTLVSGTPLTTGGWIWEEDPTGAKKLNGEFAAGDWAFRLRLYTTQAGVNATVWVRILKSNSPDPQAVGALTTVISDWASVFTSTALPTTATVFNGIVSVPSAIFTDEYMFFEFQLQVTDNTTGNATTNVVFQIGGLTDSVKARITGALFSYRNRYTLSWNTEFASTGNHVVKVETTQVPHETNLANNVAYSNPVQVSQLSTGVPPLDVSIDVGTIHFRGEIAEFYITVTSSGRRSDVSLNASMLFNRVITGLPSTDIEHIALGIYSIRYPIPASASAGTYALVVDASRLIPELNFTQTGSALKSFLVSPTFAYWDTLFLGWNTTLMGIEGDIATINTAVGEIRANLTVINATLSGLIIGAKDEILAEIDTSLGSVITRLGTINATVTTIQGDTATITSSVGDMETSISGLQSTVTLGLVAASALSAIAAVVAGLILLRLRKAGK
jgi:hypothetical protein